MNLELDPAALKGLHQSGGQTLVEQMIRLFLENTPKRIATALEAEKTGNWFELERAAHSMKSSDVKMPQMDGWTFIKFVRAHRDLAAIPVIFLTGASSPTERERGLRLGAEGYLVKPVDPERLLSEVAAVLDRRGQPRKSAPAAEEAGVGSQARLRMSGRMDQMGLLSIFSVLGAGERTGVLEVIRGAEGDRGRVLLRKGRVASARVEGRRPACGLDAVETLGRWREGLFTFIEEEFVLAEDPAASLPRV